MEASIPESTSEERQLEYTTSASGLVAQLRELWEYRELLWTWTGREIKVRYKQSVLGAAWAVLQPLSLTVIFTVVFSYFARVPTGDVPYPVFAYVALLPWTLMATSVTFASPSLVNNMALVSKIFFPKEVLPLAAVGAALVDYLVALAVFLILVVWYGLPVTAAWAWVPVLVAIQVALIVGISLIVSAVNAFYRDIRFVVPLALQVWMYASPVIYPETLVPERWRGVYFLNPMAGVIGGYRRVFLEGNSPFGPGMLSAALISLSILVVGYLYFKRVEPDFADLL